MTRRARAVPALLLGVAVIATACRKDPEVAVTPDEDVTVVVDSAAIRDSIARARAADEEARRRAEEAERSAMERRMAEARSALTAPIYFGYDQAELSDDARATLDAKIPLLVANPGIQLRIGGHTDSRGSDEYNLALAQRRAASVRAYLQQRGIEQSRMEIVSYGEERPAVPGDNEGAWAQNRRAEFEVMAGELTNVGGAE